MYVEASVGRQIVKGSKKGELTGHVDLHPHALEHPEGRLHCPVPCVLQQAPEHTQKDFESAFL